MKTLTAAVATYTSISLILRILVGLAVGVVLALVLLRRAAEHLEAHAAEFPGYDPDNNILKRCTTDGNLIQTH